MDIKHRILKEAGIMFSRYGIKSVTMEYIANELGISKRTIYEKFNDKDELIMQAVEEGSKSHKKMCFDIINKSNNIVDAMFKITKLNSRVFQKINPLFFEDLKKYYPQINNKIAEKGSIRDYSLSGSLLNRGMEEGIIRNDLNIEVVNIFIHKCIDIVNSNEFAEINKEDIRNSVFIPYLVGVSTDKGRKLIETQLNNF
ncbi:MAG: TetR/AcrR family transcriptional regulator [Bacteroidales bacterium]|jgi:hypothetical protein|nr:TetR/AcrR family transcriptional regulator [Bacteroidales bacterium]